MQRLDFNRHNGFVQPAMTMGYGYGAYGPQSGMMDGYGGFGMIIWLVILIAIVALVVWLVRSAGPTGLHYLPPHQPPQRSAGLDILEERYARGEINSEEHLEKKDMAGGPGATRRRPEAGSEPLWPTSSGFVRRHLPLAFGQG